MKLNYTIASSLLAVLTTMGSTIHAEERWHPFEPAFHYLRVETSPTGGPQSEDTRSYQLTIRSKMKFRALSLSDGTFAWLEIVCGNRVTATDPHQCTIAITEPGAQSPLNATIKVSPGERVVAGELQKTDGKRFSIAIMAARETMPPFDHPPPAADPSRHSLFLQATRVGKNGSEPLAFDLYQIQRVAHIRRFVSFGDTELQAEISCADRQSTAERHQCKFDIGASGQEGIHTTVNLAPGSDVGLGEIALADGSRIQIQVQAYPVPIGGGPNATQ